MHGFRKRGYKAAASRYYRRRNVQAKKRQRRKFTRQQKVSIKTIKSIATNVAKRLDRKKSFKNWMYKTIGTYFDTPAARGKIMTTYGIANRPTPYMIGAGDGNEDLHIERQHSLEEAGPDLVEVLLHKRKSDNIYCTGVQCKGVFLLPAAMGFEYIRFTLVEARVTQNHPPTATDLAQLIHSDLCMPAYTGFIEPIAEDRAIRKNSRVVFQKTWAVKNLNQVSPDRRPFNVNVKLKNKLIRYADEDTDGVLPLNRFYWAAFTCWGRHDDNQGQPTGSSPEVCCNLVLRYHEKLT